jgi:hypothetical protein
VKDEVDLARRLVGRKRQPRILWLPRHRRSLREERQRAGTRHVVEVSEQDEPAVIG